MICSNPSVIQSKAENFKVAAPSKRDIFLATYRRQQEWSLPPDSLIYYITKNSLTPKCYEKMIQSCKHFYIKNPILVVSSLDFCTNRDEWLTKFNDEIVDLKKIGSKIWVSGDLHFQNEYRTECYFFSSIISKFFYQIDIVKLVLLKQNITVDDLKFVGAKVHEISFFLVTVMEKNDDVVPLEKIIEILPSVKILGLCFDDNASKIITSKTVEGLLKIPHFNSIQSLEISDIPEAFDIDAFLAYIKKNKNTDITLYFDDEISDDYQARLQGIVDEIIEDESGDYKAPLIFFPGITVFSCYHLHMIHNEGKQPVL